MESTTRSSAEALNSPGNATLVVSSLDLASGKDRLVVYVPSASRYRQEVPVQFLTAFVSSNSSDAVGRGGQGAGVGGGAGLVAVRGR